MGVVVLLQHIRNYAYETETKFETMNIYVDPQRMGRGDGQPLDAMQHKCNAMQCNAMQCNAMQCNAMQYNTTLFKHGKKLQDINCIRINNCHTNFQVCRVGVTLYKL